MTQNIHDQGKGWQTEVKGGIANIAERIIINQTRSQLPSPRQAPPLPIHYVDRPEYRESVQALLLDDRPAIPGTLVVSAIYGLGGIGKSVLAAAVAHAPDVEAKFRDGTLWAVLGQQPDILSFLNNWIRELGDDYQPTTVEPASKRLRTLLHDKKVLLVVDDVWHPSHVEPFRVGGIGCRLLVTTREATIPAAIRYDLDVMKPEESLALLTQKVLIEGQQGNQLNEAERNQALALADAVGYLPLALELAAAQIANGVAWADLLAALRAEVARLETFDIPTEEGTSEETRKNRSLMASFNLSVRRLSQEQQQQFAWLGVLPEDATITSEMAATLWSVNAQQADSILRALERRALLTQATQVLTYQLHDLLHDLARNLLTDPSETSGSGKLPGLGLKFSQAHAVFLNRYRLRLQNNLWHTLPDDGYIHTYLIWHLEKAELVDEIHQLLCEENESGRNGWYEARQQLRQIAGYSADVQRAWYLAEAAFPSQPERSISLQCRYALITASLNSLIGSIPPAFMVALVEKSIWNPLDGLTYIKQIRNPTERAETLKQLISQLPAPIGQEILRKIMAAVRGIQDESDRAHLLVRLAARLPRTMQKQIVQEAMSLARPGDGSLSQALELIKTLSELKLPLSEALLREVLVNTLQQKKYQMQNVEKLAPLLPETLLQEALEIVHKSDDKDFRAEVQYVLAPYLPKPQKEQALEELLTYVKVFAGKTKKVNLAYALKAIAQQFPELLEGQALRTILRLVRRIRNHDDQARVLAVISAHLPEKLNQKVVLQICKAKMYESDHVSALLALEANLSEPKSIQTLRQKLRTHFSTGDETDQLRVLKALAPHLAELEEEHLKRQALTVAQSIEDAIEQNKALINLLPYLSEPMKGQTLQLAFSAIRTIEDASDRAEQLTALMPYVSKLQKEGILQEALAVVQKINNDEKRAKILSKLACHLSEPLRQTALKIVQTLQNEIDRALVLSELELYVSKTAPQDMQVLQEIEKQSDGNEASNAENSPYEIWQDEREKLRGIRDEITRLKALEVHKSYHPPLEQSSRRQNTWYNQYHRVWWKRLLAAVLRGIVVFVRPLFILVRLLGKVLVILTACLPKSFKRFLVRILSKPFTILTSRSRRPKEQTLSWDGAIDAASCIENEDERISTFNLLAPRSLITNRRRTAKLGRRFISIEDKISRTNILGALASHLSAPLQQQVMWDALYNALSIEEDLLAFHALMNLAPYVSETVQEHLLWNATIIALGIQNEDARIAALKVLAPYQSYLTRKQLLRKALPVVRKIEDEGIRTAALGVLAPYFPEPLQEVAPKANQEEKQKPAQIEALVALIPNLSHPMQERLAWQAFKLAQTLQDKTIRVKALTASAPYLSWALRHRVLDEILDSIPASEDKKQQAAEMLIALAPGCLLGKQSLRNAFRLSRMVIHSNVQSWMLKRLLPLLPDSWSWKILQKILVALQPTESKTFLPKILIAFWDKLAFLQQTLQKVAQAIFHREIWSRALCLSVPFVRKSIQIRESFQERVLQETLTSLQKLKSSHTRSKMLMTLMEYLPKSLQQEALKTALNLIIKDGNVRSEALTTLIPQLPQSAQQQVVIALQAILNGSIRSEILVTLAPHLSEPLKKQCLQELPIALRAIADDKYRVTTLNRIMPHLPETMRTQLLQAELIAARTTKDRNEYLEVLTLLAPNLPESLLKETLSIVQSVGDEAAQVGSLAKIALDLPYKQKEQWILQAVAKAKNLKDRITQAEILVALSPCLPKISKEQIIQDVLRLTQEVENGNEQTEILKLIAPHLSEPLIIETLEITQSTEVIIKRTRVFSILVQYIKSKDLRIKLLKELLKLSSEIKDENAYVEALCALLPNLPELLLQEVLEMAGQQFDNGESLKKNLNKVLSKLSVQLQNEAITAIQATEGENDRAKVLDILSRNLSWLFLSISEQSVREIQDTSERVSLLAMLDHLKLKKAYSIQHAAVLAQISNDTQANILASIVRRLSGGWLLEALNLVQEVENEVDRIAAFTVLMQRLMELLQNGVMEIVETLSSKNRSKILTVLLPHLVGFEKGYFLQEARTATENIEDPLERVRAIAALLPYSTTGFSEWHSLPEAFLLALLATENSFDLAKSIVFLLSEWRKDPDSPEKSEKDYFLEEALVAIQSIEDGVGRIQAVATLLPYLPKPMRARAFQMLDSLPGSVSERDRLEGLAALSPYIFEEISSGTLQLVQLFQGEGKNSQALILNSQNLQKLLGDEASQEPLTVVQMAKVALQKLLNKIQSTANENMHVRALILLAQQSPEPIKQLMQHNALTVAQSIKDEGNRAEALCRLAPHLTEVLLHEVFLGACQSIDQDRPQALESLAPFLSKLPVNDLHSLWTEALHALARRNREDFLKDMCALTPTISRLGGPEALAEIALAIRDVGQCWR